MQRALTLTVVAFAVLATLPAQAGMFGPKASREPMPAREIERPLDLPRGWAEFGLYNTTKLGVGAWTDDGKVEKFDDARWTYNTSLFRWRFGLSRRAEIGWDVPVHIANLRNDQLGTNTTGASVGDIRFRYRYRLYEDEAPLTSVVAEVEAKGPTGRETPGTYVGGPNQVNNFIFTSGQWDLYMGAAAKKQVGPFAFTGRLGYDRRFSGNSQFVVETNNGQFAGRIKPGDRIKASANAMLQLGPVALDTGLRFEHRQLTRLGVTANSWFNPGRDLVAVSASDGWALDLDVGAKAHITRGFDVRLDYRLPIRGEDLQFFPIEDIQPTYGQTFGAAVEVRF